MALGKLAAEDRAVPRRHRCAETAQTVIKGMGELHLEIIVDRLKREFKVDANVGAPQVAYRETISPERRRLHPPQADRRRRAVRPHQAGHGAGRARLGFIFENKVVGGAVPRECAGRREGIEVGHGVGRARRLSDGRSGDPAGRWRLPRGRHGSAWRSRSRRAPRSARRAARRGPVLLEPVMAVEVVTPGVHGRHHRRPEQPSRPHHRHGGAGECPGDHGGGAARDHVRLQHPALLSQGRAQFTMTFDHYEPVPQMVAQEIQAKYA